MAKACRAPARASARWLQKPISRNDEMLVNSPEHHQQQQVVRKHHAQHGGHEQHHEAEKLAGESSGAR